MRLEPRYIIVAALLLFVWKGAALDISWPPNGGVQIESATPDRESMAWASSVRPIVPKMLPTDAVYLARFYDAMVFVIGRDNVRPDPVIKTTDQFAAFHAGSLKLAIDKAKVGIYPGLDVAIDETFLNALGPSARTLTADDRRKIMDASAALAHTLMPPHE